MAKARPSRLRPAYALKFLSAPAHALYRNAGEWCVVWNNKASSKSRSYMNSIRSFIIWEGEFTANLPNERLKLVLQTIRRICQSASISLGSAIEVGPDIIVNRNNDFGVQRFSHAQNIDGSYLVRDTAWVSTISTRMDRQYLFSLPCLANRLE